MYMVTVIFFPAYNMHAQVKNQRLGGQYTITIGKI